MLFVVEEKGRNLDFGDIFQQLGELTVGFSAVVTRVNAADIVKVFLSGFIRSDNVMPISTQWLCWVCNT